MHTFQSQDVWQPTKTCLEIQPNTQSRAKLTQVQQQCHKMSNGTTKTQLTARQRQAKYITSFHLSLVLPQ